MTTPGPRFFSHPQGTVYSNVPNVFAVNAATATGLFQVTPYASGRWDSAYIKTIVIVAGVAIVAVEPHANALACAVLPLGDRLCYSGTSEPSITEASVDTAPFLSLGGSRETKIGSIGEDPVRKLRYLQAPLGAAGSFGGLSEPTASFSEMFSGDGSSSDISVSDVGAPPLGDPLVGDLEATRCTHDSSSLVSDVGWAMDEELRSKAGNSDAGSPGNDNSRGPAYSNLPPTTQDAQDNSVDVKVDPDTLSSQTVRDSAPPPAPPLPSFITSEKSGDKHRTTLLDWKFIMIALAVFVGFKQVSHGILKRSSSTADRGQKKKPSSNKIESTEHFESASNSLVPDAVVLPSETFVPNVAGSSLEWISSSSPTLHQGVGLSAFGNLDLSSQPIPSEMNVSTSLFVNPAAIDTETLSTVKDTACNVVQNGVNLVHLALFLGILLMILLVYLGSCLAIIAVKISQTLIDNIIKSSLDNNAYEQMKKVVPGTGTLPHDMSRQDDVEKPLRNTLPLGCVFLTQSGPCTIDPRPTRQITLHEERQTFGLPLEFPASPSSPSTPLPPSCLAGTTSRPGSPKSPRKVTFSEQNEIFILPPNTATRDRNLRRRLSRRAMAAAGGTVSVAPVAKRR